MNNNFNQLSQIVEGANIGCATIKEISKSLNQCECNIKCLVSLLETTIKEVARLGGNLKAVISCCINSKDKYAS